MKRKKERKKKSKRAIHKTPQLTIELCALSLFDLVLYIFHTNRKYAKKRVPEGK